MNFLTAFCECLVLGLKVIVNHVTAGWHHPDARPAIAVGCACLALLALCFIPLALLIVLGIGYAKRSQLPRP